MWYDMIWHDIYDDMIYVLWYDIYIYYYIWYDDICMIWCDIWYDMIWYDMIWYDMIWYDMWCDVIWYDMIYLLQLGPKLLSLLLIFNICEFCETRGVFYLHLCLVPSRALCVCTLHWCAVQYTNYIGRSAVRNSDLKNAIIFLFSCLPT
jgi:hypothetical protein